MGEAAITLRTLDVLSAGDADGSQNCAARALAIAGGPQRIADAVQHRIEILDELPLPVLELLLLPLQGLTIARQGAERRDESIDHTRGSSVVVTVVRQSVPTPGPESQVKSRSAAMIVTASVVPHVSSDGVHHCATLSRLRR